MSQDGNGGNREEVPLERIVLSNIYSMEALIDVLVDKGLVTKEEVIKRIERVIIWTSSVPIAMSLLFGLLTRDPPAHLIGEVREWAPAGLVCFLDFETD